MSRYCSDCAKAHQACICAAIVPLLSHTELIILQHPTEEKRALGSACILSLSLANSRLFVGENFSEHEQLNKLLVDEEYDHYVLFPNEQAISVEQVKVKSKNKRRIIIIDGTWKKAYKIWQLSANLHVLPSVALPTTLKGHYRIRKAPSENSLSTVEAGFHILSILEPEQEFTPLIDVFESMIDFQIKQMPDGVYQRNYLKSDQLKSDQPMDENNS
jgi:DTW domain-containing protein YfiP